MKKQDDKLKTSDILKNAKEAKLKAMSDLSAKVSKGEATAQDAKQISQLIQDFEDETRPTGRKHDLIVDRLTLAAFFDVSVRQVGNWQQHDPPCPQIRRGWWNLKDVLAWWLDNIFVFKGQENDETFMEHRRTREKWNAELARLKVEEIKGGLVSREAVINSWVARYMLQKTLLCNLPPRVSPLLIGKPLNEIKKILEKEVRSIFREFQKIGDYTPEAEMADENV